MARLPGLLNRVGIAPAIAAAVMALGATTGRAADSGPLEIDVWTPPFNKERARRVEPYRFQPRAAKKWNLCVSFPHLKDAYWLGANYGILEEANRLGVAVTIKEAGGYDHVDVQRKQIEACMATADALIVGAISKDQLNALVERYTAAGKPVIDLINGIESPKITARVAADFYELGGMAGAYLLKNTKMPMPRVAWFPGPAGADWAEAGDQGLRNALKGKADIVASGWGDVGLAVQARLLKDALDKYPNLDFIVGTAVTAEAAVAELRRRPDNRTRIISYYFGPGVYRAIQRGTIDAAPSDAPVLQSRLAVDVAVKALEKLPFPRHISARLQLYDRDALQSLDPRDSLAPDGFRPIFSANQ